MVELRNNGSVLNILGLHAVSNRVAVNVQTAVGIGHQVVVAVHTGIVGLVVQFAVVTGNNTVGIEGVGMAGTAGPGHLVAVGTDKIIRHGIVFCRSCLCLFPLGDTAALGQIGQIIVAVRGSGRGGIKIVGVVGNNEEVHIVGLHGVFIGILQLAGTVGILRSVGVELAVVEAVACLADEEGPGHFHLLAVGTGDLQGDRMTAVKHVGSRTIGDLVGTDRGSNLRPVDRHDNFRRCTAVGNGRGNSGPLVAAGGGVGSRRHFVDHGFVLDCDLDLSIVADAVFVGRRTTEREGLFALECGLGNLERIGVAIHRGRLDLLGSAGIGGIGHLQGGDLGQFVQRDLELIVQADVGVLGSDGHLRVEDIAQVQTVFHLEEAHGKELGASVKSPAAEGVAEILDADGVAAILCSLIIEDVAAGSFFHGPPAIVLVESCHVEALGVIGLAVNDLVGGSTQVLTVAFKGIIVAILVDGKDQGTVAHIQLAVRQL